MSRTEPGRTIAQMYTRVMIVFFVVVGIPAIIRPLTDAEGSGFILWPQAARVLGVFLGNWVHVVVHLALAGVGLLALGSVQRSRRYAQLIFVVVALFLILGFSTASGVWLVPAHWPQDVPASQPSPLTAPSWYGYIPLNAPDNLLHCVVAAAAFLVGFTPLGLRSWSARVHRQAIPEP